MNISPKTIINMMMLNSKVNNCKKFILECFISIIDHYNIDQTETDHSKYPTFNPCQDYRIMDTDNGINMGVSIPSPYNGFRSIYPKPSSIIFIRSIEDADFST
jgi:hypothetical protein